MNPTPALPAESQFDPNQRGEGHGPNLLAALWRYRLAVLLPALIGLGVGFMQFLKTPETFQASVRLMMTSDHPAVMNRLTGELTSGLPSLDILKSHMFSDRVISKAFDDTRMKNFYAYFGNNMGRFAGAVHSGLNLSSSVQSGRGHSEQAMVVTMSFKHGNAELCEQMVAVFSEQLQELINERHRSSRGELIRLISVAMDQIQPRITELENRYREFRTTAPLVWNAQGAAINPHRERQLLLTKRRSEIFEQMREKTIVISMVKSIADEADDPTVALRVIGQLVGKSYSIASPRTTSQNAERTDIKLADLELDRKLVPLMIERNKYAAEFGASHPKVREIDTELTMMKSELKRLIREETERIIELMEENKVDGISPEQRATDSIKVILAAANAEVELLKEQINEFDQQIAMEKSEAIKLGKFEQENSALLREIDRNQVLLGQFQEQMARVNLTEEEGGTELNALSAPTSAHRIGPNMSKSLTMAGFIGLAIGCGLALLLEKNANTFRDPDEIVEAIGSPILTHVPFFKGKVRKSKKDSPNPFENLDPYLAVVHQPASVPAEAIRSCRTSIFFDLSNVPGGKILQVTSPLPGDGKSTIAGNLACSIAQSGKKTLLIDCDLRRPQITDNFNSADNLGLIDVLNGHCEHVEAIHDTPLATLKLMPSGPIPANPAEALTLTEMGELLELLRDEFDYIIIDTPPLLVVTDPSILASMVDAVVMTLKIRRKSKPNLKEAATILRTVGARLIGVVVNNSDESSSSDGYKGYGYYRYGRHTNRYYRKTESGNKGGQRRTPIVVSGRATGLQATAAAAKPISVATSNSTNGTPTDEV